MKIPAICHNERIWWEQIDKYRVLQRRVQGRDVLFILEETTEGFVHSCSVGDLCRILNLVPTNDWDGLQTLLLRQPTRKENLMSPCWGRLAHSAEIGQPGETNIYEGPAIILEAVDPSAHFKWNKSLSPSDMQEFNRLKGDGHVVQDQGKYFLISPNADTVRATQLYRTVLHEIGHWVDWLERVERPSAMNSGSYAALSDAYWSLPSQERESYAHKYADTVRRRLQREASIPFEPIKSGLSDFSQTELN